MKILVYGSTYLTELALKEISTEHEIVGVIPSKRPIFKGNVSQYPNDPSVAHDIKLSIQYDQKLTELDNAWNVHTGLLPEYGGCDILYHSLKNGVTEQGITFHRMTENFDQGGIVSEITYPVFPDDKMVDLYARLCQVLPPFIKACLRILPDINGGPLPVIVPTVYRRGAIMDISMYKEGYDHIIKYINDNRTVS